MFYPLNYEGEERQYNTLCVIIFAERAVESALCAYEGDTAEHNTKPTTLWWSVYEVLTGLCADAKELGELALVKTHNHIFANEDDRNAHLAALINHLLTLLHVCCDIEFVVGDIVLLKEFLCHLAEMTGRGSVNGDLCIHVLSLGVEAVYPVR